MALRRPRLLTDPFGFTTSRCTSTAGRTGPSDCRRRHIHCYPPTDYSLISTIRFASTHRRKPNVPDRPVRTRFAPSPTGYLHLGSLRTALFNYLLARRTGGQFVLRIEDTDQKRTIADAEDALVRDLSWAGLEWDEGPGIGGPYGPYRQSDRTSLYQAHAHQLIASGHAYRCFCTQDRLFQLAETRHKLGIPTDYDRHCFGIATGEAEERAAAGERHVIRLKAPRSYPPFADLVYGTVGKKSHPAVGLGGMSVIHARPSSGLEAYDDPILLKSDGQPTYHLANVVDDHHMAITHVIRGSEWLIATPKHIALYDAFGWQPPEFAHVGLLVDGQGSKLSKRNLDDIGISKFRQQGILPEALTNFVALMGWSHDKEKDLMDLDELAKIFTLKFTKGNTILDTGKLQFLQSRFAARRASAGGDRLHQMVDQVVGIVQSRFSPDSYKQVLNNRRLEEYVTELLKADANNYLSPQSFVDRNAFFFAPDSYDPVVQLDSTDIPQQDLFEIAKQIIDPIEQSDNCWQTSSIQNRISTQADLLFTRLSSDSSNHEPIPKHDNPNTTPSKRTVTNTIFQFLRSIIFADRKGPSLAHSMHLVGQEFCRRRLSSARTADI